MMLNVTACEYLGRTKTGRSHPMRCACEDANGNLVYAYVKYENFHEDFQRDHLVGEAVANLFAVDIRLPAATPCLVKIEPDFVHLLPNDPECDQLRIALAGAPLVAFGSVQVEPGRRWSTSDLVRQSQRRDATFLYLYDTIVENTDRGLQNPNLLMSGLHFQVIDFGHAFQRCHEGSDYNGSKLPWQVGGIGNHYAGNLQHIMFQSARLPDEEVLTEFTNALVGLSDAKIMDYLGSGPIKLLARGATH